MANKKKRFLRLFIPGIIRNDFWRKLVALIFALLIYFTISIRIGGEMTFNKVPVLVKLPPTLGTTTLKTPTVSVTVKTSKGRLQTLSATDLKIVKEVQANKYVSGMPYILKLTPQDVNAPFGVQVIAVTPDSIRLNLEKVISRQVKVNAGFNARELPPDYIVGKVRITPSKVWITGIKSIVNTVDTVNTKPIPLDNQTESFDYSAALAPLKRLQISPEQVNVSLQIVKYLSTKIIKPVPIKILSAAGNSQPRKIEFLSNPNVTVTVSGPQRKVSLITPRMVKAFIDVSSLDPGKYSLPVECKLNVNGIKIKSIYPPRTDIKISKH